jgi:hypothetical protein
MRGNIAQHFDTRGFSRVYFARRAPVGSAVADLLWQGTGDGSACTDAAFETAFSQKPLHMQ